MSFTPQDEIDLKYNEVSEKKLLVFFITGNPGLIGYYQTFLTLCYDSLRSKYKDHSIHVFGTSLAGFDIAGETKHDKPFDLEHQIQYIDQTLTRQVPSKASTTNPTRAILLGHSVGSYILLEVLRRQKSHHDNNTLKLISGICLFPTITHIAKSLSGKRISLLFKIPYLPFLSNILVNTFFSWWPTTTLQKLVSLATAMPPDSASVTTAFLQSKSGVRQALHLAQDEMRTITTDKWDDEIWGVVTDAESSEGTKLFFLFGTDDHWVADETRDELIAARAAKGHVGEEGRPCMEIDESGIPHGFCIRHNEAVARRVLDYVDEAVRAYW
ncbi:hypothetical protein BDV97DRAFT_222489 [Delphinella strobiligena]|nr:hypothetical protein BDV97DRAFT_222489 [Delphinella strobiligena]